MSRKSIAHLTSVHRANDARILYKECQALAENGFEVTLIARRATITPVPGVAIRMLTERSGYRLIRMTRTSADVLVAALRTGADAYHFHDPELIPIGILLKLRGKRVVYDIHEDNPNAIRSKYWIPVGLRRPIAWLVRQVELLGSRVFDGIVAATPGIEAQFARRNTVTVQNFVKSEEFAAIDPDSYRKRASWITCMGSLTEERGLLEMIRSIEIVNRHMPATLMLGGAYAPDSLRDRAERLAGWAYTESLGWLTRSDVGALVGRSRVGLVMVHPVPNLVESYPTKLFEFLAAGVPVVASNFPHWRQFVEDCQAGIMVDPLDPEAIAKAIVWLLEHPQEAEAMGRRGREMVLSHYAWEGEAAKLAAFYRTTIFR